MPVKYLIAWVPMLFIAIGNALFRETVFAPRFSELQAHQLSTATCIILFAVYIWALLRLFRPRSNGQAIAIGLIWLVLTVAFEFLFGRFVMGHPWNRLLNDYNLWNGRLWPILLLWVAVAPYLFHRLVLQKEKTA